MDRFDRTTDARPIRCEGGRRRLAQPERRRRAPVRTSLAPVLALLVTLFVGGVRAQEVINLNVGTPVLDDLGLDTLGRLYRVTPGAGHHLIVTIEKVTDFASQMDLKFKAAPTEADHDDRDGGSADLTDQAVEVVLTKTGSYFILVTGDAHGRYTIAAQTEDTLPVLAPGASLSDDLVRQGGERYYSLSPGGAQHLFVTLDKAEPFASRTDLRFKFLPETNSSDASSGGDRATGGQAVEIRSTKAGTYFVRVSATCCDRGGAYTLTANTLATLPLLMNGVPLVDDAPAQGAERYYRMTSVAGAALRLTMDKLSRFASQLDIRFGTLPNDVDRDGSDGGDRDQSDQSVLISPTKAGDYFARVKATCCDNGGRFRLTVASSEPPACAGDCNGDGEVTVDELLLLVNISLDAAAVTQCRAGDANGDGAIAVNEIIAAVNRGLAGCGP